MMRFDILTIFPRILDSYLDHSIMRRAIKSGLIAIETTDIRAFSMDKHKKVDDHPYGGGPGMVMSVEPIARAVAQRKGEKPESKTRTILMSARGKQLDEKVIRRLLAYDRLILICGRYEGVDERVAKYVADEEVSIGPYILAGGELPALALAEAVSRHIPGVLGADESLESVKGSYPVYTRPEAVEIEGKKRRVPRELLSGNHTEIAEWRKMYCARAREDRRRVV